MWLLSDIINFANEEQVRVRQYVRNGRIVRSYTASRDIEEKDEPEQKTAERKANPMEGSLGVPLALLGIAGIAGIAALVGGGKSGASIAQKTSKLDPILVDQKNVLQQLKVDQLKQQTELQKVKGDQLLSIAEQKAKDLQNKLAQQQELEKLRLTKLQQQVGLQEVKGQSQEILEAVKVDKIVKQTELENVRLEKLVNQKKIIEATTQASKAPLSGRIPEELVELRSLYQTDKSTAMTKFYASLDNTSPRDAKIKFIQISNIKELSTEEASKIIDTYEKSVSGGVSVGTFKQKVIKEIDEKSKSYQKDLARYQDDITIYDQYLKANNDKVAGFKKSIANANRKMSKLDKKDPKYKELSNAVKELQDKLDTTVANIKPDNSINFKRQEVDKIVKALDALPYEVYAQNFAALGTGRSQMELKQYLFLDQYLNKNPEKLKEFKDLVLGGSLLKNYRGEEVGFSMLTGEDAVRNAFEYGYTADDIKRFNISFGNSLRRKKGFEGVTNIYKVSK